jgi:hypothetical protein
MAVHVGARRVGGVAYQLLAVFLTYSAVVMTYVPMIANEIMANEGFQQEAQAALSDEAQTALPGDRTEDDTASSAPSADAGEDLETPVMELGVDQLAAWVAAIPIAYMLPFLMGFENAIGILIIGFALWQAFRMNARAKIELQGPFRLEVRDAALG